MSEMYLQGRTLGKFLLTQTAKGTSMARGLIETELVRKVGPDEYRAESHSLPIVAFSWLADLLKDVAPGTALTLGVRLNGTRFESPDGNVKHGVQLVVEHVSFAPARKEAAKNVRNP
jgi:hypothetical protein